MAVCGVRARVVRCIKTDEVVDRGSQNRALGLYGYFTGRVLLLHWY